MAAQNINMEIMEYMVWVVEIVSMEFFGNDKATAYQALKNSGLWDIYVNHYDATHTLGREYLLEEIKEYFTEHEVKILCQYTTVAS